MRFFVGLLAGLVAGAAGAVWYSQQTGRDLREEFEQIRSELGARDYEALGNRLEDRFRELQAGIEKIRSDVDQKGARTLDKAEAEAEAAVAH